MKTFSHDFLMVPTTPRTTGLGEDVLEPLKVEELSLVWN